MFVRWSDMAPTTAPAFCQSRRVMLGTRYPSSCLPSKYTYEMLVACKVVQDGAWKTQSVGIKNLRVSVVIGGLGVQCVDFIHSKKGRRANGLNVRNETSCLRIDQTHQLKFPYLVLPASSKSTSNTFCAVY
jgi:hypothetical protein